MNGNGINGITAISIPPKVMLEGHGVVTLGTADHVTSTGLEGDIFKKGIWIIKLYKNPDKMQRDGMVQTIEYLKKLQHPYIIAPLGLVFDSRKKPIGFYMLKVDGAHFMSIFGNRWRKVNGWSKKQDDTLVERMREVVMFAHANQAYMVDANERNWLFVMEQNLPKPQAIDVDSWLPFSKKLANVPKMLTIHDFHTHLVCAESDWFAWAVVTFQIYTGIHPYHGYLNGKDLGNMEKRMRDNLSVFTPNTGLPDTVRDFSSIPPLLLDYYFETFQNGLREIPPSPFDVTAKTNRAIQMARMVVAAIVGLLYEELFVHSGDPVIRVFDCGVVVLRSGILMDLASKRMVAMVKSPAKCEVVMVENYWIVADVENGQYVFSSVSERDLKQEVLKVQLDGTHLLRYRNRLFMVSAEELIELEIMCFTKPVIMPSTKNSWGIFANSTRWFDGFGIMDALGANYLLLPFGEKFLSQMRVKELDGLIPVDAKAGNRFVAIICMDKNGAYQKIEITFDERYESYQVLTSATSSSELNMAMLPKGVVATIEKDGELAFFAPVNKKVEVKTVADKDISTNVVLANWDDALVCIKDGNVFKLKTALKTS